MARVVGRDHPGDGCRVGAASSFFGAAFGTGLPARGVSADIAE